MEINKLIKQRFEELDQKAIALLAGRSFAFHSTDSGIDYYQIDSAGFRAWATSVLSLLQRTFGENSIHYQNFYDHYLKALPREIYEDRFEQSRAIFGAAKEDYEGGYLFSTRGLIQAEVFSDFLEQAAELLRAGYKGPACVVAGVALETALRELCARNDIPRNKLDRMNADLCKAGIYNMAMQKQITAWAERRNKAAHGDWDASDEADIDDMIRGVIRLVAEYL